MEYDKVEELRSISSSGNTPKNDKEVEMVRPTVLSETDIVRSPVESVGGGQILRVTRCRRELSPENQLLTGCPGFEGVIPPRLQGFMAQFEQEPGFRRRRSSVVGAQP